MHLTTTPHPPQISNANDALRHLLEKYNASASFGWTLALNAHELATGSVTFISGGHLIQQTLTPSLYPLRPWREERRFVELRSIVEKQTVENVSLLRFRCFSPAQSESLKELLYREFDLCEWIGGGAITSLYSTITRDSVANIILSLSNGVVASIEASILQPAGSTRQDRHEVIASRGVTCDRVVDTQVAQESIYLYQSQNPTSYTDTDAELFGFPTETVTLIRAALRQCQSPVPIETLHAQHEHLTTMIDTAFRSSATNRRITL
ncbi:MAG: hypothetical protein B9S32_03525 [Verrucomicrobia bacterium Tous-C9LFEB]|nr:MAG: hypothetical protein B9S32_03525 [Verrucomicrobia bacterium Tous-C9LFEB]